MWSAPSSMSGCVALDGRHFIDPNRVEASLLGKEGARCSLLVIQTGSPAFGGRSESESDLASKTRVESVCAQRPPAANS
jgi:hypothetical protein